MRLGLRSDARDNRITILTVARAAFADEGLDVTIREIARRASLGVATVYRHFPTKEALLTEAFADEMASCQNIVDEGLAAHNPWAGFCGVIEKLMAVHALNRGFARAFTTNPPVAADFAADRNRTLQGMREVVRRAQQCGALRSDVTLSDVRLVLMAHEGINADSRGRRLAASRRFAALVLRSFQQDPVSAPVLPDTTSTAPR